MIYFTLLHRLNGKNPNPLGGVLALFSLLIFLAAAPFMMPFAGGRRIWKRSFAVFVKGN